jgi:hypothetical protein
MLHNNNKHNFIGRSPPGFLPHHQGTTSTAAFGGGGGGSTSARSHGGGFVSSNDITSTAIMKRGRMSFNICMGLGVVLLIFPWVPSFLGTYYKTVSLRDDYEALQVAHKNLVAQLKSSVDTRRTLNDQTKAAEELNKNLLLALKDYGDNIDPDNNLYAMAEQVEEAYVTRIDDLESVISLWSEQKLRQKYGETKETLRFTVTLSESVGDHGDDSNNNGQEEEQQKSFFVMETARLDKMPYSIDFFQQMVQERLYDGLVMTVVNKNDHPGGVELIQAQPTTTDQSSNMSQTLLFSERSPENPLEKYSGKQQQQQQQIGSEHMMYVIFTHISTL